MAEQKRAVEDNPISNSVKKFLEQIGLSLHRGIYYVRLGDTHDRVWDIPVPEITNILQEFGNNNIDINLQTNIDELVLADGMIKKAFIKLKVALPKIATSYKPMITQLFEMQLRNVVIQCTKLQTKQAEDLKEAKAKLEDAKAKLKGAEASNRTIDAQRGEIKNLTDQIQNGEKQLDLIIQLNNALSNKFSKINDIVTKNMKKFKGQTEQAPLLREQVPHAQEPLGQEPRAGLPELQRAPSLDTLPQTGGVISPMKLKYLKYKQKYMDLKKSMK